MGTPNVLVQLDNPTDIDVCEPSQPSFTATQRLSNAVPSLPLTHPALAPTPAVEAWYTNPTGVRSSDEIIRNAYDEAKAIFSSELTKDECKRIWLREKACMADIISVLADLKQKYDNKPESKARKWLVIFSGKVIYYSTVLDVLVQQYPEYVSLAWGTMKFLFIAVNNHEEKTRQLAKALSRIGEVLPRIDVTLMLYPTGLMSNAVAHLYARIIKFMIQATKWYKQGKFVHTFSAISKPWTLNFKDNVEDIAAQSRYIDELSGIASKAELRDTHLELLGTRAEVREIRIEIRSLADLVNARTNQLLQTALSTRTLQSQVRFNVNPEREAISSNQLSQIASLPIFEALPSSQETLSYCQSLQRRKRGPRNPLRLQISLLELWATSPQSSLLLLDHSFGSPSKYLFIDLVRLFSASSKPVIWVLRFADYWDTEMSHASILRMLVIQVLQLNHSSLTQPPNPLTSTHFDAATSDMDWLHLLNRSLVCIPQIFIALDAALLVAATGNSTYGASRWLETFLGTVNTTSVKIFVESSAVDSDYIARSWEAGTWIKVSARAINEQRGTPRRRKARPSHHRSSGTNSRWLSN